ncbi:MAG TPA: XdhC family protein [Deltaproteobacteria bacterium]|nr:XdhC family protein [Deltaproteobacteria bacterium]
MIGKAQEWISNGKEVALATVIATWGSSPRPVGSQMVIDGDGRFEGSVSGGCIEGAVIEEAMEVIRNGEPRRVFFGVTQERAWEVGLACGGEIEIFVEKVTWKSVLDRLVGFIITKRPACLVTELSTGDKYIVPFDEDESHQDLPAGLIEFIKTLKYSERNCMAAAGDRMYFLHCFQPDPQLIIVGAVHIAKALALIGRTTGYEVILVDPREAFADAIRFPEVPVIVEWPDEALENIGIHSRTAVVTLTHDSKLDDPALMTALRSDAFYIGALGSRRTHSDRLERLKQEGFSEDQLKRIHGPVGLGIGAIMPEEIAIAIMAQIVEVRRKGETQDKASGKTGPGAIGKICCS